MSQSKKALDLYQLLPSVYRLRDAQQGYPLRALLDLISEQADNIKQNIDGLWDDFFIETCAEWVIPYIGKLVGNNPLHEVVRGRRADVAKTIYYRRRKGTLAMLEELARDVTGWAAHAVEFFQLMGWTQNMNHERYWIASNPDQHNPTAVDRVGTVNLRNVHGLDWIDGPFDIVSHTADVRPICQTKGWHNIKNVGFFLWRLQSYPLCGIKAYKKSTASDEHRYYVNPLGHCTPMFTNPEREAEETKLATEIHVPGPIRPLALAADLLRCRQEYANDPGSSPESEYYGKEDPGDELCDGFASFTIWVGEDRIPPYAILCMDLDVEDESNWPRPPNIDPFVVGVDVRNGRLSFRSGHEPQTEVKVQYHYGFSADIGGGPYERRDTLADSEDADLVITVSHDSPDADENNITTAVGQWDSDHPKVIIRIDDSWTYDEDLMIEPVENGSLVIEATNKQRPTLIGNITIGGSAHYPNAGISINGLLIDGVIDIQKSLDKLQILHCTLVPQIATEGNGDSEIPGEPSIKYQTDDEELDIKRVYIDHSIVGAVHLPKDMTGLFINDSIVDGLKYLDPDRAAIASTDNPIQPGPPTTIERTTILGEVSVKELTLANEVIFDGNVSSERTQKGCVRFSYVPVGSQTPRRFQCQPDLALAEAKRQLSSPRLTLSPVERALIISNLQPGFTSFRYGDPAYCQLSHRCPVEIKTGAENGSEMGVYEHLRSPHREANLKIRLEEYLPYGLKPGIIYVT